MFLFLTQTAGTFRNVVAPSLLGKQLTLEEDMQLLPLCWWKDLPCWGSPWPWPPSDYQSVQLSCYVVYGHMGTWVPFCPLLATFPTWSLPGGHTVLAAWSRLAQVPASSTGDSVCKGWG